MGGLSQRKIRNKLALEKNVKCRQMEVFCMGDFLPPNVAAAEI